LPIHGEYRQLARHARVARDVSDRTQILLAENGDCLRFRPDEARIVDRVPAGRVLIDGTRTGEVGDEVLRDRRHLAADGLLVPVLAIGRSGVLEGDPELITRGFVVDPRTEDLLRDVPALLRETVESATVDERTDPGLIKEKVRVDLQRFIRKRVGRRPLVLPVIMEI
jgi:ribonuclease J